MVNTQLKSLGQIFSESYSAVRRNLPIFIFLNAATILGTAWNIGLDVRDKSHGSNWVQVFVHSVNGGGNYPNTRAWLSGLLGLATLVLALFLGFLTFLAAKKNTVGFGDVWSLLKKRWWQLILTWIVVVVCIIAGFFALILPGFYLISRLALAPYVTIDEGIFGYDALRRSWQLTEGHAWLVFVTVFFALILSLPSIIPIVGRIVSVALVIAYSVAVPIRYFELKALHNG